MVVIMELIIYKNKWGEWSSRVESIVLIKAKESLMDMILMGLNFKTLND